MDIPWRNDQSFHNCNTDSCDPVTLEHYHQEHWLTVSSDRLSQDGHLTVAQLGTAADDKEDDYGLLDDKSLSASFGFHQKVQTAHSFSS